jgi:hypothetical protein
MTRISVRILTGIAAVRASVEPTKIHALRQATESTPVRSPLSGTLTNLRPSRLIRLACSIVCLPRTLLVVCVLFGAGLLAPVAAQAQTYVFPGPSAYGPMYDAYGNFAYGATGEAANIPLALLQFVAQAKHNFNNDPINSTDINSGFNAIAAGGTLTIIDYNPPGLGGGHGFH